MFQWLINHFRKPSLVKMAERPILSGWPPRYPDYQLYELLKATTAIALDLGHGVRQDEAHTHQRMD